MKHHQLNRLLKPLLLIALCFTAFIGTAKAGLDFYEIYLGKKLVMKRYLNEPLSMQSLPVTQANAGETLVIHYYQCNAPGRSGVNRSIIIKDAGGNKMKEWKFANAKDADKSMRIPVKELLQLQKAAKDKELSIYYVAEGREQGERLAVVKAALRTVTYHNKKISNKV